jgi:hypothetical protein
MRVLKWFALLGVSVALVAGYMFISAYESAQWLDQDFARRSRGWTEKVTVADAQSSTDGSGGKDAQAAAGNLRRPRLKSITPATCTYGPEVGWKGEEWALRSHCVLWATSDKAMLRFDFELSGFWKEWTVTEMDVHKE